MVPSLIFEYSVNKAFSEIGLGLEARVNGLEEHGDFRYLVKVGVVMVGNEANVQQLPENVMKKELCRYKPLLDARWIAPAELVGCNDQLKELPWKHIKDTQQG